MQPSSIHTGSLDNECVDKIQNIPDCLSYRCARTESTRYYGKHAHAERRSVEVDCFPRNRQVACLRHHQSGGGGCRCIAARGRAREYLGGARGRDVGKRQLEADRFGRRASVRDLNCAGNPSALLFCIYAAQNRP